MYKTTADLHVWCLSPCRLDVNNDWQRDWADVDALLETTDPHAFAVHYPGLTTMSPEPDGTWVLGPSAVWHADADCVAGIEAFDLNMLIVNRLGDCYAECDPLAPLVPPSEDPIELGLTLLQNVDVGRWPVLVGMENELAVAPEIGAYWQAVLAYQQTTHVDVADPNGLDFGPDLVELSVTLRNADPNYGSHSYSVGSSDPAWLTIVPTDLTPNVFESEEHFTVTVNRCPLMVGESYTGAVSITVLDGNTPIPFGIPVALTKELTSPRIVPWVELWTDTGNGTHINDRADPNEIISTLAAWRRVTDTVCITWLPVNDLTWIQAVHAGVVQATNGYDVHIIPALNTNSYLQSEGIGGATGWGNIANAVSALLEYTGEATVALDMEDILKCTNCYWENPDPAVLESMRDNCLPLLPSGVTYLWYPGFNINNGMYDRSVDLAAAVIEGIALIENPPGVSTSVRLVDTSYGDDGTYLNARCIAARGWENNRVNNPTATFPIIWFGLFSNGTCYWPYHGHETDTSYDPNDCLDHQLPGNPAKPHVMNELRRTYAPANFQPRQDAFFYPGRTHWVEAAEIIGDWACHTENWQPLPQP